MLCYAMLPGSVSEAFRGGMDGFHGDCRRAAGQEAWGFSLDDVRCENVVIVSAWSRGRGREPAVDSQAKRGAVQLASREPPPAHPLQLAK